MNEVEKRNRDFTEKENLRLRMRIQQLEHETKLAYELIKQHEENQKDLLAQLQLLNALQGVKI